MKKIFIFLCLIACIANAKGQQWIQLNSGTSNLLPAVYFTTPDTGYVGDEAGNIMKTSDGGAHWNIISTIPTEPFGISFINSKIGLAAGGSIVKTSDGGLSWTIVFPDSNFIFNNVQMINKDTAIIFGFDDTHNGIVYITINGENTWTRIIKLPIAAACNGFFTNSKNGVVTDGTIIYKTINGGIIWTSFTTSWINSINSFYFNNNNGFAVGNEPGEILITTNSGSNWSEISESFSAPLFSIYFTSKDTGYAVGGDGFNSGTIIKTYDGGSTWSQATTTTQTFYCVQFPDANTGYTVGDNGTILKYTKASGIDENNYHSGILNIYPNPTTDKITIEASQNSVVEISNSLGQLIKTLVADENKTNIDVSGFTKGIYILKVQNADGVVMKKFVKK